MIMNIQYISYSPIREMIIDLTPQMTSTKLTKPLIPRILCSSFETLQVLPLVALRYISSSNNTTLWSTKMVTTYRPDLGNVSSRPAKKNTDPNETDAISRSTKVKLASL